MLIWIKMKYGGYSIYLGYTGICCNVVCGPLASLGCDKNVLWLFPDLHVHFFSHRNQGTKGRRGGDQGLPWLELRTATVCPRSWGAILGSPSLSMVTSSLTHISSDTRSKITLEQHVLIIHYASPCYLYAESCR